MSAANWGIFWGGGLNIFISGPKRPPRSDSFLGTSLVQAMAKFAPHMGDPHGDPQTSPQHADPLDFLYGLKKQEIHVGRRLVGWSAGRPCGSPMWGGQISLWPARKVTNSFLGTSLVLFAEIAGFIVLSYAGSGLPQSPFWKTISTPP